MEEGGSTWAPRKQGELERRGWDKASPQPQVPVTCLLQPHPAACSCCPFLTHLKWINPLVRINHLTSGPSCAVPHLASRPRVQTSQRAGPSDGAVNARLITCWKDAAGVTGIAT